MEGTIKRIRGKMRYRETVDDNVPKTGLKKKMLRIFLSRTDNEYMCTYTYITIFLRIRNETSREISLQSD